MERDPLRFVWRTAPVLHLLGFLVLLAAIPLAFAGLDLVRVAIDDAVHGRAFADGAVQPFLRLAVTLPERVAEEPLVLFPGIPLPRTGFAAAAFAALGVVAVLGGLLALLVGLIEAAVGARVVGRLRRTVLDAILSARPSVRDTAVDAATLAGEGLARENGFLGSAVLAPVMAGGAVAVALVYALTVDWRLAAAALVALAVAGLAQPRALAGRRAAAETRLAEGALLRRSLADLVRRLPALRAHGTARFERDRLAAQLSARHAGVRAADRRTSLFAALAAFGWLLGPALVLGLGAWIAAQPPSGLTAGQAAAVAAAVLLGEAGLAALARWRRSLAVAQPLVDEIARTLGSLQARGRSRTGAAALPGSGALVAEAVTAYDPDTGGRIAALDLSVAFPAHVAVVGEADGGARVFAALIGGQIDPSAGRLTFGGVDLASVDPAERARRIAFSGGETIVVPGSLRDNLVYGSPDPNAPDLDRRASEAAAVVGLDGFIHARGLANSIDPAREPKLAAAIVDARRAVRAALAARNLEDLVDPFDPTRYNHHATTGENILFGMPLGDTFRESNLPSHPFVRAILEAEDLMRPLAAMGLSIAASMVEIFADIPDGHPLFERFSFFAASERGYFEDLIARQSERRRGAESARDRERLIGLALRYNESRHRLGLLDADLEQRLVNARKAFAELLPTSLQPAIEFYDPDKVCAAASLKDNLLFGRIAHDRAGAEEEILRLVRHVLTERGLDDDVVRIGLSGHLDPRAPDLGPAEHAAIDLVRCLVRRPDVVVIENALAMLPSEQAAALVGRLRRALVGRGLVVVMPDLPGPLDAPPFDGVIRFERGVAHVEDRRRVAVPEPVPA